MKNLRPVYEAVSKKAAEKALDELESCLGREIPDCDKVVAQEMGQSFGLLPVS